MLTGKTALVTGSTSGIGLGIAQALAAQGANIILNGFGETEGPIAAVRQAAGQRAIQVEYHGADMSKADEIAAMMAFAAERFGRVDILVNNAGIQHVAPVQDFPVEKWDAILAINLSSAFHTTRLALPAMQQANWGRIINVCLRAWLGRLCPKIRLRRRKARHCGPDQSHGPGKCHHRSHLQRHLPRLGTDSPGAKASGCQSG